MINLLITLVNSNLQESDASLPPRQKLVAIILSMGILTVILELVRRRKLREEYAVLWLITGIVLLVLSTNYGILIWFTHVIGAVVPTSTLFFLGLFFLILVSLQFSVRLSTTTRRIKILNQKLSILENKLEKLEKMKNSEKAGDK